MRAQHALRYQLHISPMLLSQRRRLPSPVSVYLSIMSPNRRPKLQVHTHIYPPPLCPQLGCVQTMVLILDGNAHVRKKICLFGEKKIRFATALDLIKCLEQIRNIDYSFCASYHLVYVPWCGGSIYIPTPRCICNIWRGRRRGPMVCCVQQEGGATQAIAQIHTSQFLTQNLSFYKPRLKNYNFF